MINEIFIDDDIWGTMYAVEIPGGGTLTAEWGNGETEQATIKMIMFERNGLNRKTWGGLWREPVLDSLSVLAKASGAKTAFGE